MSNLNPLGFLRHHHDIWDAMRLDLDLDEEALLARLFDIMHRDGGPIPNDPVWLSRACRVATRTVNRILPKLLSHGFIQADAGGKLLSATYIETELQHAGERSSRGKRAADTRWRADRKSDAKRGSSADERRSNRESSGVEPKFDREKENKNNEPPRNRHCREDIDIDAEGLAPSEPAPNQSESLSSGNGPDAREGASGQHQSYAPGQTVEIAGRGCCQITSVEDLGNHVVKLTIRDADRRKNFCHQAIRDGKLLGAPFACQDIDAPVPAKKKGRSTGAA